VTERVYAGRPRPGNNFELYSWFFMRISGLLLILLVIGHMVIMHIINNVDVIDYDFVAARWASIGWRAYDWLLLFLALLHGANGVRVVIDDYVRRKGWKVFTVAVLYTFTFILLILGSLVIITFEPIGMGS